jgi:hypothetical protein
MSRHAHCLPLLIITALLSGCSHKYEEFSASDFRVAIVEATKKCSETVFDRTVPQVDCYSAAELPQIRKCRFVQLIQREEIGGGEKIRRQYGFGICTVRGLSEKASNRINRCSSKGTSLWSKIVPTY